MNRLPSRLFTAFLFATLVLAGCSAPAPAEPGATSAPATESAPVVESASLTASAPAAESAPAATDAVTPVVEPAPVAGDEPSAAATTRVFAIDPTRSDASYAVAEEFLGRAISFVTAVGKTQSLSGQIGLTIDGSSLSIGDNEFTADLSTLTSDQPRRDNAIRRDWLQSSTYPLATFKATEVTDLPADAALGSEVAFTLAGDMTIREITQPLTWDVKATLDGSTLSGVAQAHLLMNDYGFDAPNIAGMLKVTDGVTVTVNFVSEEVK